ncbi:MAG: HEAT repeat domain-containing protein, partial [Planctomycetes bacterium]|nr:HEAT repeat domain-containing protein [Planctomycetota bacterium]
NPQSDLSTLFSKRIADTNPMNPEDDRVRQMSAASLGRMQAKDALPTLREFYEGETVNSPVGYVCGWAVHQITGEAIPKPVEQHREGKVNTFLFPLNPVTPQTDE